MAITIQSMSINPGDPVTSDLLSSIITNLQTVAKGETVSNISVDAAGLANKTDGTAATVAYNTVVACPSSVTVKSATAGGTEKIVSFGKTFVGTPQVWVQINTIGQASPSWANSQIFPQVTAVGSTSATIRFRTNTANTKVQFTVFVAGQLA